MCEKVGAKNLRQFVQNEHKKRNSSVGKRLNSIFNLQPDWLKNLSLWEKKEFCMNWR